MVRIVLQEVNDLGDFQVEMEGEAGSEVERLAAERIVLAAGVACRVVGPAGAQCDDEEGGLPFWEQALRRSARQGLVITDDPQEVAKGTATASVHTVRRAWDLAAALLDTTRRPGPARQELELRKAARKARAFAECLAASDVSLEADAEEWGRFAVWFDELAAIREGRG